MSPQQPHFFEPAAGPLKKIFGSNVSAIYKDARAGDVRDSQADISKAATLLGYKPAVGLEDGLRETVKWFKSTT